jgi:1,4-alpha-glucan branching enzyme
MKTYLTLFISILLSLNVFSQVVSSDPALPFDNQAVKITFNASEGSGGLEGYSGDVYAHIGVLTDQSGSNSQWRYVKTNYWGENTPETKLTRVEGELNLYELNIQPDIRNYFGVPQEEVITHLAMVFRSDLPYTGSTYYEGKGVGNSDIFIEVFELGLIVSILSPSGYLVEERNTDIAFSGCSTLEADLRLYANGTLLKSTTSLGITETLNFSEAGDYWVKLSASAGDETLADSVFIHILADEVVEEIPQGMKDGINYIDNNSLSLSLFAPFKKNVIVIGDFNNWLPASEYRMKRDGNRYWITIDNLNPGQEYAYQYLIDGTLKIADPYTEKVLDPKEDKWISDETYPDLKEYPFEKTSEIVSVFQTNQEEYTWKNEFIPHDNGDLIIYEMLLRDFIALHDWKTLTDTLDYFSALGVNAIELMPFNEFEGNESWGYNPSFYFAPDKYYGPKNDLKAFIDECHGRGIAVIMDMVFNHSFGQSPLVRLYMNEKGWPTSENPWFNEDFEENDIDNEYQARHPYSVGYDFDHSTTETQDFIDRVSKFWLEEYKIDGFRFDLTKGITQKSSYTGLNKDGYPVWDESGVSQYDSQRIGFLKRMADEIWKVNDKAYVILEHFTANDEEKALAEYGMMIWGNANFNYNEATMGYHDNNKSNFSWISYKNRGWSEPHVIGYMESHDEERLMFKNLEFGNSLGDYNIKELETGLKRIELAAAFFFTIPGPKMIWQFGEMGYDFSIDYNGRVGNKPIRWDYYDSRYRLRKVFSELIKLRTSEPAFTTTDFKLNVSGALKRIEINHEDMNVRVIGNFDVSQGLISAEFNQTGTWYEFFSGEEVNVSDPGMEFNLEPGEYRIFTTKQFEVPDISNNDNEFKSNADIFSLYPNPVEDILMIRSNEQISHIMVTDVSGRIILSKVVNEMNHRIDFSAYDPGLYFISIKDSKNQIQTSQIIKK